MNRWKFMKKVLKLHLTKTKVTTFYISLELKIRPKISKVCQTRGRSRSSKNYFWKKNQGYYRKNTFDFFFWNFWEKLENFQVHSKLFQYSRGESITWCNDRIYYNKLFEIPGIFWSFSKKKYWLKFFLSKMTDLRSIENVKIPFLKNFKYFMKTIIVFLIW